MADSCLVTASQAPNKPRPTPIDTSDIMPKNPKPSNSNEF